MASSGKKSAIKKSLKFTINCAKPVDDEIFDINAFEKYLHDRIKVNGGKAGQLQGLVSVTKEGKKVAVVAKNEFSKRYLKYLTKKFLKKHQLRDFIRVVADSKATYDLRYFNIRNEEEADQ